MEGVSLNVFDIIVVLIIGYGMYRGFQKGILMQLLGIFGVFVAAVLGIQFNYVFREFFAARFDIAPQYITLLSFALVFIIVLVVLTFLFRFLDDLLTKIHLGGMTKAFGALVGGYLSALVLSLLLLTLSYVNIPSQTSVKDSVTYPYLKTFVLDNLKLAYQVLPVTAKALRQLENTVKPASGQGPQPASPAVDPVKPTPIR